MTTGGGNVPSGDRYVVLTWDAPTTRTDGSCLSALESYKVSYGLSPSTYEQSQTIDVSQLSCNNTGQSTSCGQVKSCTFMVENLGTASWYFAVQAQDIDGRASAYSNEVVKTVQ